MNVEKKEFKPFYPPGKQPPQAKDSLSEKLEKLNIEKNEIATVRDIISKINLDKKMNLDLFN